MGPEAQAVGGVHDVSDEEPAQLRDPHARGGQGYGRRPAVLRQLGPAGVGQRLTLTAHTAPGAPDAGGGRGVEAPVGDRVVEDATEYGEGTTPRRRGDIPPGQVAEPFGDVRRRDLAAGLLPEGWRD